MVVELANLGRDLSNLPPFEAKLGVEYLSVLLLELPQFGVDVEGASEVGLPLFVSILGQVSAKGTGLVKTERRRRSVST